MAVAMLAGAEIRRQTISCALVACRRWFSLLVRFRLRLLEGKGSPSFSSLRWFVFDSTCSRANGSPSFFVALELSARVLGLNKPCKSNVMVYSYNIIGRRPSSLLHDTQDQSRHWHSLSLFCSVPSVVSWVVHNINSVPVR